MNMWTALVSGGAAFLGAVIAQLLTTRREERRWVRERERDAALWKREDQHRFAEHKRELFTAFLSNLTERADTLKRALHNPPPAEGRRSRLTEEREKQIQPLKESVSQLLSQIRILSPKLWPVVNHCAVRLTAVELFYLRGAEDQFNLTEAIDDVLLVAAKAFRMDLGIEPDEPKQPKSDTEELYRRSVEFVRDSKASDAYRREE